MKKIAIILLSLFSITALAQTNRNCVTPISNYVFSQKLSMVKTKSTDAQKLDMAKSIAKSNCLSTEQVKQIAELFEDDFNRLTFVQEAYLNTTDKDNFYEVYNTFMYFSNAFRLHDYIVEQKKGTTTTVVVEQPTNDVMTFPEITYPDFRRYFGKTGCTNVMNEEQFIQLAQQIFDEKVEYRKLMAANKAIYSNCFQAAHAIKIASLIKSETDRLNFLKKAHPKVYDQDNYRYAAQLFNDQNNQNEIQKLLSPNITIIVSNNSNNNNTPGCEINAQEFQSIKNQIINEKFNNTKVNLTKQILRTKKCFKTQQIIEIVQLFPYNNVKLDIAKYAYDYTTDKENYHNVTSVFTFASDKDKLLQYIKTKQ